MAVDGPELAGSGEDHKADISLNWLTRLRWGAVAGQLATIAAAQAIFGGLPVGRLLAYVAVLAGTNLVLALRRAPIAPPRLVCGAVLALDTLLLSGLLHAAGGAYNPFTVIYLVHIALAAVVLGPRWTWFLAALSVACFGALFLSPSPLGHTAHGGPDLRIHLQGMWIAFAVAAGLTAYFVVKLSAAIEERDAAMAEMRERVARHERLASLTTLAAGAAHELGTPLATIAVASKELERAIGGLPEPSSGRLLEDAGLIRSQVERCRTILNRLAADAGQSRGEEAVGLDVADLVSDLLSYVPPAQRARVTLSIEEHLPTVVLPRNALLQVAKNLLQNALDAGDGAVALSLGLEGERLRLVVSDHGPGMSLEVLRRVGEPFYSTKPAGAGLGLGVFIARSLSEQMGGSLRLDSIPGRGTTATVEIAGTGAARGVSHAG